MILLKTVLPLIIILIIGGCSGKSANLLGSDRSGPVIATVSSDSVAFLADSEGNKITNSESPNGIEVFLNKGSTIIVEPKNLSYKSTPNYMWQYILTMLLVFTFLLVSMYIWEKLKRRSA